MDAVGRDGKPGNHQGEGRSEMSYFGGAKGRHLTDRKKHVGDYDVGGIIGGWKRGNLQQGRTFVRAPHPTVLLFIVSFIHFGEIGNSSPRHTKCKRINSWYPSPSQPSKQQQFAWQRRHSLQCRERGPNQPPYSSILDFTCWVLLPPNPPFPRSSLVLRLSN